MIYIHRSLEWRLFVDRGFSQTLFSAPESLSLELHLLSMMVKRSLLLLLHIYRLDCGLNSIGRLVGFLEMFFEFFPPCFYLVFALSRCKFLFFYCGLQRIPCTNNTVVLVSPRSRRFGWSWSKAFSLWCSTQLFGSPSYSLWSDSWSCSSTVTFVLSRRRCHLCCELLLWLNFSIHAYIKLNANHSRYKLIFITRSFDSIHVYKKSLVFVSFLALSKY